MADFLRPNSINSQPIQTVQFEKKRVKWDSYGKESVQSSLYTEPLSVKLSETSFDVVIDELYNNLLRIVCQFLKLVRMLNEFVLEKARNTEKQAYLLPSSL